MHTTATQTSTAATAELATRIGRGEFTRVLQHPATAWITLLCSLVITAAAWYLSEQFVYKRAQDRFEFKTAEIRAAVAKRMTEYEEVLRGGVGLFQSVGEVSRQQWRTYYRSLDIDRQYPGLQGFGYSMVVQPQLRASIVARVRAEGYPQFDIHPAGDRSLFTTILYLEPLQGRNLRAFGFDMFSEPVRREAMERARDTGLPAVSGIVTLVQETKQDVQRGFLMYVPVYQQGADTATVEQRQNSLRGYVYSPFRVNDLMRGILGSVAPDVDFEIFDSAQPDESRLLYDNDGNLHFGDAEYPAVFTRTHALNIGGRIWSLYFASRPDYVSMAEASQPILVAIGGIVIDVLLFVSIMSISNQHQRARELAQAATAELQEKEQQFQAVADTATDAIVTADSSGNIVYFNRAAEEMFGVDAVTACGQPLTILMPPQYHTAHVSGMHRFRQSGIPKIIGQRTEISGQRRDGTEFPLEISLACWRVSDRMYFTAHLRDITERKNVERLKSEFISTVSHEMRTPLSAIHGSLGLVASGALGAMSPQAAELIDVARGSSERLVRLTNDMLDIQKMESGKLAFEIRPLDAAAMLADAQAANSAFVSQHHAILRCEPPRHEIYLLGDSDRVMQVITNLVSNAAKFSPPGGQITVQVEADNERVRFSVSDQGPGVPDDFRARMFEKFAQADGSSTRQKSGTGLGLSISRMLVERMDGEIGFYSEAGKGATFYFELPRARSSYRYVAAG